MATRKAGRIRVPIAFFLLIILLTGAYFTLEDRGLIDPIRIPGLQSQTQSPQPGDGELVAVRDSNGAEVAQLRVQDYVVDTAPYDRKQFGQAWSDDVTVPGGHNGCDTRNDILQRDLTQIELKPGTHNCVVLRGELHDPYSGTLVAFQRGQNTSAEVQIDHVIPLADAWYSGAHGWDAQQRRNFANDPANLQATTAAENQAKKAKTLDQWLPTNQAYWCDYAYRQVVLKRDYQLTVTSAEVEAMNRILGSCPL